MSQKIFQTRPEFTKIPQKLSSDQSDNFQESFEKIENDFKQANKANKDNKDNKEIAFLLDYAKRNRDFIEKEIDHMNQDLNKIQKNMSQKFSQTCSELSDQSDNFQESFEKIENDIKQANKANKEIASLLDYVQSNRDSSAHQICDFIKKEINQVAQNLNKIQKNIKIQLKIMWQKFSQTCFELSNQGYKFQESFEKFKNDTGQLNKEIAFTQNYVKSNRDLYVHEMFDFSKKQIDYMAQNQNKIDSEVQKGRKIQLKIIEIIENRKIQLKNIEILENREIQLKNMSLQLKNMSLHLKIMS